MNNSKFSTFKLEVTGFAQRLEAQSPGCLETADKALSALRQLFRQDEITRLELMAAAKHAARLGVRSLTVKPRDEQEYRTAGALKQAVQGLAEWLVQQGKVKPVRWAREVSYHVKPTASSASKLDADPVIKTLVLKGLGTQVIRESDFYPWHDPKAMSRPDSRLLAAQRELSGYYTVPELVETGETAHFTASSKPNGWGWVYFEGRPEYPVARVRMWGFERSTL